MDANIYFNGNVVQQCAAGTYPQCRVILLRQLQHEVARRFITQQQADEKMQKADALWAATIGSLAPVAEVARKVVAKVKHKAVKKPSKKEKKVIRRK